MYPLIKQIEKIKRAYPAIVIFNNGVYALYFCLIHPPEFNGMLYLCFIPISLVHFLKLDNDIVKISSNQKYCKMNFGRTRNWIFGYYFELAEKCV